MPVDYRVMQYSTYKMNRPIRFIAMYRLASGMACLGISVTNKRFDYRELDL